MDRSDFLNYDVAAGAARATTHLRRLLDAGFTTVRDVDSRTDWDSEPLSRKAQYLAKPVS